MATSPRARTWRQPLHFGPCRSAVGWPPFLDFRYARGYAVLMFAFALTFAFALAAKPISKLGPPVAHWFVVAGSIGALTIAMTALASAGGRAGVCPDYGPLPTLISRPNTIGIPSPNFGDRGNALAAIDAVVIHTTEVSLAGTLNIFQNRSSSVSAHFVVAPNGDIYEMVDTAARAWHATYYNSRSIGIEMVGYAAQSSTWNEDNLDSLVGLLSWIVSAYPAIPLDHPETDAYDFANNRLDVAGLVEHGQVQPWNRSDPGPFFPWDAVLSRVAARAITTPEPTSAVLMSLGLLALLTRQNGVHGRRT